MLDQTSEANLAALGSAAEGSVSTKLTITVKGGVTIEVDTNEITDNATYAQIFAEGLKVVLNRGQTKNVTKGLEGEALEKCKADIKATALANLEKIKEGKLGKSRTAGTTKKASRELTAEAMRLAKKIVKEQLVALGRKVSRVKTTDITAAAKTLVQNDPSIMIKAQASLDAADAVKSNSAISINLPTEDADLVAKAEKTLEEAKAKKGLSAAQAGKTAKRGKQTAPLATVN